MEKTMARAIYKLMEVGKSYTTSELYELIGDDYYKYIPVEMHGKDVRKIVSAEMWKCVETGYARTYTEQETLPILRGVRFGNKPTAAQTYTFRYWVRLK